MEPFLPPADWARMRWRFGAGPHKELCVYAQSGPIADDEDRLVCVADSREPPPPMTTADTLDLLWRQGRAPTNELNVYARRAVAPSNDDELVAIACSPQIAAHITAMHNIALITDGPERR